MAKLTSYFVSCVLLTMCWRLSTGAPVHCSGRPANNERFARCTSLSLDLLQHIRTLLNDDDLFSHVRCSEQQVEVTTWTDTASVCAPFLAQNSICLTPTNIPSSFNESKCLGNIVTDLAHYAKVLQSYLNTSHRKNPAKEAATLTPTIRMIEGLRKNCSLDHIPVDTFPEEYFPGMWEEKSFNNRKRLCEVTRGFYIRAITINRALGYISSGDHRTQGTDPSITRRKTTSRTN